MILLKLPDFLGGGGLLCHSGSWRFWFLWQHWITAFVHFEWCFFMIEYILLLYSRCPNQPGYLRKVDLLPGWPGCSSWDGHEFIPSLHLKLLTEVKQLKRESALHPHTSSLYDVGTMLSYTLILLVSVCTAFEADALLTSLSVIHTCMHARTCALVASHHS